MLMPSMVLPTAEWISSTPRQASVPDAGAYGASSDSPPSSVSPQPAAGIAGPSSSESQHVDVHRGSGGLVRGRAVFCLPPDALWFQGHFAYAARGGCTASLGVLGTELPVDPCMQCCHGGFSRHKLAFIHHESGKESTLAVERYGGNMMSLHAEASGEGDGGAAGDGPMEVDSDLSFQTHVMKADDDARPLLDRYFQSIVRASTDPAELQECIVCIGQMDVPLSLLQELAAPLPDVSRSNSMVCSAFSPCREMPQLRPRRAASKPTPALSPYPPESTASSRHARVASSPSRSVTSRTEDSGGGEAVRPGVHREREAGSEGGEGGDVSGRSASVEGGAVAGGGDGEGEAVQEEDDDWL